MGDSVFVCVCMCVRVCVFACVCMSLRAVRCCPLSLAKPLISKHQVSHSALHLVVVSISLPNEQTKWSGCGKPPSLWKSIWAAQKQNGDKAWIFLLIRLYSGCDVFPSEWFDLFLNSFREHIQTPPPFTISRSLLLKKIDALCSTAPSSLVGYTVIFLSVFLL